VTRQQAHFNEEHLRQGSPTNATFAETCSRTDAIADLAIAATGVVLSVGVPFQYGEVVRNITFVTGATAAGTPTAGFAALYTPAGALIAQTADFATTARAANTVYTVALTGNPNIVTAPGLYYIAISFTATTVPTLRGVNLGNSVMAGNLGLSAAVLAQTHGSAVGGVAPATIATPTASASLPYMVCT
jgi:hypothetical protein